MTSSVSKHLSETGKAAGSMNVSRFSNENKKNVPKIPFSTDIWSNS